MIIQISYLKWNRCNAEDKNFLKLFPAFEEIREKLYLLRFLSQKSKEIGVLDNELLELRKKYKSILLTNESPIASSEIQLQAKQAKELIGSKITTALNLISNQTENK